MAKTFDKMNKTELEAAAKAYKVEDQVKAEAAANERVNGVPTNLDYVTVLEAYKAKQEEANPDQATAQKVDEAKVESGEAPTAEIDPKSTNEEARATKTEDLHTLIPVIVTDHETNVTIDEDSEARLIQVTYGNPIIGMTTVGVAKHGNVQNLPKGAVIRLKRIPLATNTQDAAGKPKAHRGNKRFSVAEVKGMTAAEFEALGEAQKLKALK